MRLLHLDDNGIAVHQDFNGRAIPPYAILSHRWGDSEVLFEDIVRNRYQDKVGRDKIDFCAKQAAHDELRYFWIDTCCIDKWNNRERTTAINSMFRWYHHAKKCYVFLSDVSVLTETQAQQRSAWEAQFRASKWFTRGWTLQELIAPNSVEFFCSEGYRLGDKISLCKLIHDITGIPVEALRDCTLKNVDKHERITWVEGRETTEPEDIAYCLLGILDVFMLPAYGEGKKSALNRLNNELLPGTAAASNIPYSRNYQFVGRESQIALLESKLFGNNQTTLLAVSGAGGTGKSQLVLEIVFRIKETYKNCSVFWIDASDTETLYQSYISIARKLDIIVQEDERIDVKLLVKHRLSEANAGQWLVVIDNADDLDIWTFGRSSPRPANLSYYMPHSAIGSILFTTTDNKTAKALAGQDVVELQELTPNAARTMFEIHMTSLIPDDQEREVDLLLQELGYLPLSIVQAAGYINTASVSLEVYRSRLLKIKQEILESGGEVPEKRLEQCIRGSVAETTIMALLQIAEHHTLAADALFLMACFDRKDILLDLLGEQTTTARKDMIIELEAYALVTRRPADLSLDMHRLVHRAISYWLVKQEMLQGWIQAAIAHLLEIFPDHQHWNRSKWGRLLPHAKHILSHKHSSQELKASMTLARKCAMVLFTDGRYDESEKLFSEVVETERRVLGEEHPHTLTSIANLASTYRNQGRWMKAEELQVKVMETRRRVLGEEHPDTLTSMDNLASTYWNQGRWKKAEELQVKVIETRRKVLGEEHPDTLTSMDNLASTYWNQGRWKEAEKLLMKVMEVRGRVLGEEHPHTLTSIAKLASTYWIQGRWKEAEELEVKVIEIRRRVLGEEHPDALMSIDNLASTYCSQGRWKEAEELEVNVMEVRRKVLGEEHPDTLTSIANLATTYWNQGRWKEAEELQVKVTETRRRVLGEEHPDTLMNIHNLASTYWNQGRWKEAEELQVKVIEIRKRVLGEEHPHTLMSMANLASMYRDQGRWKEAEELQVKVIETRRKVLGEEHPHTLTSMNNLALIYSDQERWAEAEELQTETVHGFTKL